MQCLGLAKEYLKNTFINCMTGMKDTNQFRNRFQDQLQVNYREWMFKKVDEEHQKEGKSDIFQTGLITTEMDQINTTKESIKKTYEMKMQKKEKVRRIESTSQRSVHLIFNPGVPSKITPFTRKYKRLIQGTNIL